MYMIKGTEYRTCQCSVLNVCGKSHVWNANYSVTISKYMCYSIMVGIIAFQACNFLHTALVCSILSFFYYVLLAFLIPYTECIFVLFFGPMSVFDRLVLLSVLTL